MTFDAEAERAEAVDAWPVAIYLAAGARERWGLAAMTTAFGETLQAREYDGLRVEVEVLPRENHASIYPPAFETGLRFVMERP